MISKIRGTLRTPVTIAFSVVAGMLSVSLTGCTAVYRLSGIGAVSTTTSRDAGFNGHPTRIYIVSNLTAPGGAYGISLDNDVQKRMIPDIERCGGHAVFERVNAPGSAWTAVPFLYFNHTETYGANTQPLAGPLLTLLNQDDRKTRIGDFKADVVLTTDLTTWLNGRGVVDSGVWDLRTKKFVWTARSAVNWANWPVDARSMSADGFVTDLMRKLRDDGMVPACGDESTGASQAVGAATGHNDGSAPNGTAPSH